MKSFFKQLRLWGAILFTLILVTGIVMNWAANTGKESKSNSSSPSHNNAPANTSKPKMNFNL